MYDYLIIGAGLFGATFARQVSDAGRRCLVIEKRPHIAGNCYTESVEGIQVHKYGPHIFHTSSEKIWKYVNQFAQFNHFVYRPRVSYHNRLYSFPINLMTLYQLWGVQTPAEAKQRLECVRIGSEDKTNLKAWLLSQVGSELYEIFYEGYTTKQWGRDPVSLPASLVKRIPIRLTFDDNYFDDCYQGIPIGGYTSMIQKMLTGIPVQCDCDYFGDVYFWRSLARKTLYTGPIDQYFDYCFGRLEYRSLRFETEVLPGDFQGVACINYTAAEVPYTRIVEHKHFTYVKSQNTVITREYPLATATEHEPLYPINDTVNNALYRRYEQKARAGNVLFGGRLATYKYYDMHHVIAQALTLADQELKKI